jgi:pimeloyl-ACP methyl ester carboxylesterase
MTSRFPALLAAGALLLSACSTAAAAPTVRDQSNDVPFTGCDQVACTGVINGAEYEIVMPDQWNGTLLIYSHGYRPAEPFPPTFNPVTTNAEPVPGWDEGNTEVGDALLDEGYAIAGSAYASNGWAVEDGVRAGEEVYEFFSTQIGMPNRVYVWGDSLGGLITQTLAEQHPEWVDGAAPLCGVVAGVVPNIGLAFDAAYGVQQLLVPDMQIVEFGSYAEALAAWEKSASLLIESAKAQDTEAIGKMLTIAAIVDAPSQTGRQDGASLVSSVTGTVESLLTALAYGTVGRYDIEQRFGGNVSGNEATDYASRISEEEATQIDAIGGEGAAARNAAVLDDGPRTAPDAAARAKALEAGGNPSGAVQVPTITMHTKADPLVIVENESFFKDRYDSRVAAGEVKGGLVQLYTVPPPEYSPEEGAPYGAGHCNFTPQSRLAVIDLLDAWVRDGVYPGQAAIAEAMGTESGYSAIYAPGPWPDPLAVVLP